MSSCVLPEVTIIPNLDSCFRFLEKSFLVVSGRLTFGILSAPLEKGQPSPDSGNIKLKIEFAIMKHFAG